MYLPFCTLEPTIDPRCYYDSQSYELQTHINMDASNIGCSRTQMVSLWAMDRSLGFCHFWIQSLDLHSRRTLVQNVRTSVWRLSRCQKCWVEPFQRFPCYRRLRRPTHHVEQLHILTSKFFSKNSGQIIWFKFWGWHFSRWLKWIIRVQFVFLVFRSGRKSWCLAVNVIVRYSFSHVKPFYAFANKF